ncbi:competence/damage-inducible protein A [Methylococcus sp. EFPC2]|uniref:competence/damage-inducible protein A n=1 Tax=Methylococcus sp. EFPC2 TaxID=2812648 RepID=UPI0019688291|nr:molybdopterin-binding protein [Methylococcus sp. EFPC2]QSA96646.1 competence/damage-inducible protein A [Methylococcus sp. EFPC2]
MTEHFPQAEILSQGEEVVSGSVVDTNAAWLAQELVGLGFDVTRHTIVGDRLGDLAGLLSEIADRADCCVCTGGLGPTVDDLTAAAVAQAFGLPLRLDDEAWRAIQAWYASRNSVAPETNRKQALLPAGSQRLDNRWGTAPGFALAHGRCRFYFLPGVPMEMREIFGAEVRPRLTQRFAFRPPRSIVLRTVGVGESMLQARMDQVSLPVNAELGFCVVGPEVHVKLRLPTEIDLTAVEALLRNIRGALGDGVFSIDGLGDEGGDLATVIGRMLSRRNASLAIAETVSAGQLAHLCAGLTGLRECRVYPDTEAMTRALALDTFDSAVSGAAAAAQRLREQTGADYVLVQFESAGLHLALLTPTGLFGFDRPLEREPYRRHLIAAAFTLDKLRRHLASLG